MVNPALGKRILEELDHLPPELQQRVLDLVQSLGQSVPRGVPGENLLPFAGVLTEEDARVMAEAISAHNGPSEPRSG